MFGVRLRGCVTCTSQPTSIESRVDEGHRDLAPTGSQGGGVGDQTTNIIHRALRSGGEATAGGGSDNVRTGAHHMVPCTRTRGSKSQPLTAIRHLCETYKKEGIQTRASSEGSYYRYEERGLSTCGRALESDVFGCFVAVDEGRVGVDRGEDDGEGTGGSAAVAAGGEVGNGHCEDQRTARGGGEKGWV